MVGFEVGNYFLSGRVAVSQGHHDSVADVRSVLMLGWSDGGCGRSRTYDVLILFLQSFQVVVHVV